MHRPKRNCINTIYSNFENNNPNPTPNNSFNLLTDDGNSKERPLPKTYILPDGKTISRDGDCLTNLELFWRECAWKVNKLGNNETINTNMRRFENFSMAAGLAHTANIKCNLIQNSHVLLENNNLFYFKLDAPITHQNKLIFGGSYAFAMEVNDIVNEYKRIPRPDSNFTNNINKISPFNENNTWNEKFSGKEIMKQNIKNIANNCITF